MSEPDLGAIISAAQAYGDARARAATDEAMAVAQAKINESLEALEQLMQQVAELQAKFDALEPEPSARKVVIGMSAPAGEWSQRVSEVGTAGLRARRIFANLTSAGNDQADLIKQAHDAGQMPVVSFKVPSVANAITGSYDAWAATAAHFLASFGKPTAVAIWHEPRGDMTPAQYVAMQERLVPIFKANAAGLLRVGPILNGFLLDRPAGRTELATFTSPKLMQTWDWFGIDTYHPDSTSPTHAGTRIAPLVDFVAAQGRPDMPLGVGEYNGYTADAIAKAGETFLSTPSVWFACMWNSTGKPNALGETLLPLSGAKLTAFKDTKSDPRAQQ